LTMVGPDRHDGSKRRTDRLIEELGCTQRVTLPGRASKAMVPGWLAGNDIFLNTAEIDNTPVSVLEAMACGLCIVSTDVGGIPHLRQHERDALLVPRGDVGAMAQAVRRLMTDSALATQTSTAARRKAEQFDWSVVLPQWEHLLLNVSN